MDKLEALCIVYDLAAENALDDVDPRDKVLKKTEKLQEEAFGIVYIMIRTLRRQKKLLKGKEVKQDG